MNYLGIDLHKRESQVAVVDHDGEIQREVRVENANLDALAEEYAGNEAAIEATGNYFTVYDALDEHLDVVLVNPLKTRWIAEADQKTDRADTKKLAQLLRVDMVAESYVPPEVLRKGRAGARPEEVRREAYRLQKRGPCDLRSERNHSRGVALDRRRARVP